ncbi:acyltransferase, partial [Steroidobacter cummioxidans]|uniref:acyltransferase n=1 Tax=Steroidobacter cummioxidans TaxID=1803913 RepID=UPI00129076BD
MSWLRIAFGALLLTTNTLIHVPPLLLVAVIKAIAPLRPVRRACDWLLMAIAASWISTNTTMIRRFTSTRFVFDIDARLRPDGHYLVMANHQTWVDIPMLAGGAEPARAAVCAFFSLEKSQAVLGCRCSAWRGGPLDFPLHEALLAAAAGEAGRELAGRELFAATRRAFAQKFSCTSRLSVMNFVEGTRFTRAKHEPVSYTHLTL